MVQTARVEFRPSGGHTYAVVVEDYRDKQGRSRKRVLQSFGNAADQRNVARAQQFCAAYNAGQAMRGIFTDEQIKAFIATILVGAAVGAVLGLIFRENGD